MNVGNNFTWKESGDNVDICTRLSDKSNVPEEKFQEQTFDIYIYKYILNIIIIMIMRLFSRLAIKSIARLKNLILLWVKSSQYIFYTQE